MEAPKQFLLLKGKPVLWYTLTAFLQSFEDIQIILVLPEEHLQAGKEIVNTTIDANKIKIVAGGSTRFHSVKNGLELVPGNVIVFVHDGVRCLVTPSLIHRCYQAAIDKGNAVPAIKATDTMRLETSDGNQLIDRDKIRIIQTPQTFLSDIIKTAFLSEYHESFTDEAVVAAVPDCACRANGEFPAGDPNLRGLVQRCRDADFQFCRPDHQGKCCGSGWASAG